MAGFSKIEWTDSTFNPWVGCTKIKRPGNGPSACDFCYAEKWAKRSGQVKWGNFARRRTTESYWRGPLGWNSQASDFQKKFGRRRRVFCASLADVFDNQAPAEWRADLFELIRRCDLIDWQLLTKRPQNIKKMLPRDWGSGYSRKRRWAIKVEFKDINEQPDALAHFGASLDDIRRRLHATDEAGRLIVGADVAIALWRLTPGEGWLAALFGNRVALPVTRFVYDRLADLLFAWNKWSRRW